MEALIVSDSDFVDAVPPLKMTFGNHLLLTKFDSNLMIKKSLITAISGMFLNWLVKVTRL
jgi:hypothetical protein